MHFAALIGIPFDPYDSQVEDDFVELAARLMDKAKAKGVKLLLPEDVVVADKVRARERIALAQ